MSLLMFVTSALVFGTIGIFRRFIPVSSSLLAFFRGVIGSLFLLGFLKLKNRPFRHGLAKKTVRLLIVSGAFIGLNWVFLFEAYNYTSVATATLCYYMEPAIVTLLSPIFFKERLTPKKLICIAVSVAGMIFVSGVADSGIPAPSELKGILFGLGAACLYSAVVIMNKKLPGIDTYEKTVIQLLSAAAVMIPYILLLDRGALAGMSEIFSGASAGGTGSPAAVLLFIAVVGIVHTGICYAMYFGGMEGLSTQTVAILSYLDPVTALILSFAFLHEPVTVWGLIGAGMILAAALVSETGK